MRILDPHTHTAFDMSLCHTLDVVDDYVPIQSDDAQSWFAVHMPTGASCLLDDLPPEVSTAIHDDISRETAPTSSLLDQFGEIGEQPIANPLIEAYIGEGPHDKHTLKAIFVAGSGGAGKGVVADAMFAATGMKVINPDKHLERFMKAAKIPLQDVGMSGFFYKARDLKDRELRQYAGRRLGLVIDGTGWDYSRIADPVGKLRKLGYDVYMVFVQASLETALRRNSERGEKGGRKVPDRFIEDAWRGAMKNVKRYTELFGKKNMFVIDNDADITPQKWKSVVSPRLRTIGNRILNRPIRNKKGQAWMENPTPGENPFRKVPPPTKHKKKPSPKLPLSWPTPQAALDAVEKAKESERRRKGKSAGKKPKAKAKKKKPTSKSKKKKKKEEPAAPPTSVTGIPPKKKLPSRGGLPRASDLGRKKKK
jgi:predicted ABC-type ATPase